MAAAVAAEPAPVLLVGHSFGGITIANVAEKLPERVRALVFVGAYLPQAGAAEQSMAKPAGTPVMVTAERYGRVPKVYVKTLRDRAISPPMQQLMLDRTPVKRVIEVDSGHSPFLSQPKALARALLEAARD